MTQFGLFVAPFGAFADPRRVAAAAAEAEAAGFDGFFLWDHVRYRAPVEHIADPWIALAAVACATERLRLGPLVTPIARRRPHKLARECVTLDHLSGGRLVLGVGLGSDRSGEFGPFGDDDDPRVRARQLDVGLDLLTRYWGGELAPRPVQSPRIPVWVASQWPNRTPLRRAARWDGWFPIGLDTPAQLADGIGAIGERRGSLEGFDVVVTGPPGADPARWAAAGATWMLTGFGPQPDPEEVQDAIAQGPPNR